MDTKAASGAVPGAAATRPDPIITADNAFFWEGAARGELLGQRCAACGVFRHPPRPMCAKCHSLKVETVQLAGRGRLNSWIIPRHPPPVGFTEAPIVALIDLPEGIRLVSNIVGESAEHLKPGMEVQVEFASTAGGKAVPVFRRVPG